MSDDRYSGFGTHHDRFLTSPEMLLIGVNLYRGLQWYKANNKRLTPQEQAQRDIDVARWTAYLLWEAVTPGAQEARENYQYEQEQAALDQEFLDGKTSRRVLFWRPASFIICFYMTAATFGTGDGIADLNPVVFTLIGIFIWWFLWRFCMTFQRSWRRVRANNLLGAQAVASRPSDNLPVLWRGDK